MQGSYSTAFEKIQRKRGVQQTQQRVQGNPHRAKRKQKRSQRYGEE